MHLVCHIWKIYMLFLVWENMDKNKVFIFNSKMEFENMFQSSEYYWNLQDSFELFKRQWHFNAFLKKCICMLWVCFSPQHVLGWKYISKCVVVIVGWLHPLILFLLKCLFSLFLMMFCSVVWYNWSYSIFLSECQVFLTQIILSVNTKKWNVEMTDCVLLQTEFQKYMNQVKKLKAK